MGLIIEASVVESLVSGNYHGDPFAVLGMHQGENQEGQVCLYIRTLQPQAQKVEVIRSDTGQNLGEMRRVHPNGLFQSDMPDEPTFFPYRLKITLYNGQVYEAEDPYRFLPVLGELDLYLYGEGNHLQIYDKLGAHLMTHQGVDGVSFAVWAPNCRADASYDGVRPNR